MLLFAPAVVLIAVLIMNAFQKRQDVINKVRIERSRVPGSAAHHQLRRHRGPPVARAEPAPKATAKRPIDEEIMDLLRVAAERERWDTTASARPADEG
jgi:hypothetical protein